MYKSINLILIIFILSSCGGGDISPTDTTKSDGIFTNETDNKSITGNNFTLDIDGEKYDLTVIGDNNTLNIAGDDYVEILNITGNGNYLTFLAGNFSIQEINVFGNNNTINVPTDTAGGFDSNIGSGNNISYY